MSRAATRGLAVRAWQQGRFVLGVLAVTAGSANAQTISAARESPLVLCCAPAPRSSMSTDTAIDTLPGLLRDAGFAPTSGDLVSAWRRYAVVTTDLSGEWRVAQEARGVRRVQIEGQGGRNAGRWYLSGAASLRRDREDGVMWRNQSAASLTGLYVWADSVGGIWRGDEVALAASVATPRWHGLSFAVPAELGLGQSARRNDPRPLSRRRAMAVSPAVRWQHGRVEMGVAGTIGSIREDLEIGGGLSPEVPVVFRMRGIATFDRTQLNSADRTLLGQIIGARTAVAIRGMHNTLVLGGAAYESTDDVRDGIATPENGGSSTRRRYDAHVAWQRRGVSNGVEVRMRFSHEEARGTDPIFRAVNAVRTGSRADWAAVWWQRAAGDPRNATPVAASWQVELRGAITPLSVRDIAGEAAWQVTRIPAEFTLQRRFALGAHRRAFVAGAFGRTSVTASEITITRPSRITPIFATGDQAVHAAPTTFGRARVGVEWMSSAASTGNFTRVSLGWDGASARTNRSGVNEQVSRRTFTLMMELL